jgi:hypothetical protein
VHEEDRKKKVGPFVRAGIVRPESFPMRAVLLLLAACAVDTGERMAPPPQMQLDLSNVNPGATVQVDVTGATPGEVVELLMSPTAAGDGACPAALGGLCYGLLPPLRSVLIDTADASGEVHWIVPPLPSFPQRDFWFQAVSRSGGAPAVSNVVEANDWGGTCTWDRFETNDWGGDSATLAPGFHDGLHLCTDDPDHFRVYLRPGDTVEVTTTPTPATDVLNLQLYDEPGALVADGRHVPGPETLTWTHPEHDDGWVTVVAAGWWTPDPGTAYTMSVDVVEADPVPGPCPTRDLYEPNDQPWQASRLRRGATTEVSLCGVGRTDHFKVDALPGETLVVRALSDQTEGNVDLALLDTSGNVLVTATSVRALENLRYTTSSGGEFLVRASLAADPGQPGIRYGLLVE